MVEQEKREERLAKFDDEQPRIEIAIRCLRRMERYLQELEARLPQYRKVISQIEYCLRDTSRRAMPEPTDEAEKTSVACNEIAAFPVYAIDGIFEKAKEVVLPNGDSSEFIMSILAYFNRSMDREVDNDLSKIDNGIDARHLGSLWERDPHWAKVT